MNTTSIISLFFKYSKNAIIFFAISVFYCVSYAQISSDTLFAKNLQKKGEQQILSEHFADALLTFKELLVYQEQKFPNFNRSYPPFLDRNLSRFYVGLCYLRTNKPKLALEMLTTSLQQMRENKTYKHDTLWVGSCQTMLAYIAECYTELGTYDISIKYYLEAEKMAQTLLPFSREPALSLIYGNLAGTYRRANNRKGAISLGYKALALDEKTTNFQYLAIDYMTLGEDYLALKELDSAKFYLDKVFFILKSNNLPMVNATTLQLFARLLKLQGKKQVAIDTLLSAAKWAKQTGNKSLESSIASNTATFYFEMGNFQQALQYAEQAISLSPETPIDKAEALHIKAKTLQALGLHKEALTTLQLAINVDSMLNNIQRLNYADGVAVHLKVREHEDKLQVATQKLKTQWQQMIGLMAGIFAILFISIALYFAYRWQKKAYFAESQKVEMEKRAHQAEAIKAAILESELVAKELAYETLQTELSELQTQLQPPNPISSNPPITETPILASTHSFDFSFESIIYCQGGAENYVDIFISPNKRYTERITLKKLEAILPSEKFRRVHKSYIINFDFLEKQKSDCFIMKTGETIPRSRKK